MVRAGIMGAQGRCRNRKGTLEEHNTVAERERVHVGKKILFYNTWYYGLFVSSLLFHL